MSDPCTKCGSVKKWKDGRCAGCAAARKRVNESARKPGSLKPGWVKKGLTKKAADAAKPKPKKLNDMKIEKVWECVNCGNRTDRWKDGSCRPCRKLRARKKYVQNMADPETAERIRKQAKEYRDKMTEEERTEYSRKTRKDLLKDCKPKWLSPEQEVEIEVHYLKARALQRKKGQKYHVDHIVPLKHPLVCGLHVPWNLRVITDEENAKKKNSPYWDPDEFE